MARRTGIEEAASETYRFAEMKLAEVLQGKPVTQTDPPPLEIQRCNFYQVNIIPFLSGEVMA